MAVDRTDKIAGCAVAGGCVAFADGEGAGLGGAIPPSVTRVLGFLLEAGDDHTFPERQRHAVHPWQYLLRLLDQQMEMHIRVCEEWQHSI